MKFKYKKIIIIISAILVSIIGSNIIVKALIDESNSVKIDAESIEDSTLIIGTHLIHISAMSDSLYSVAQLSADESAQYNMYYKSELANGTWYDITNAFSLEDITTGGIPVESKVIEELNFTHHTKSDGITYDLVEKVAVPVCDIYSPYNLEGLQELSPLKLQYENLEANEDKSETDERNLAYIRDFYKLEFNDENTAECDINIEALHKYLQILTRDGAEASMSNMVQSVMDKIDAQRRAQIFVNMQKESIDNLIKAIGRNKKYEEKDILSSDISGDINKTEEETENTSDEDEEETEETKNTIDGFVVDDNLLTALSEVVSNVEESYNTYANKMLDEGVTLLSKKEFDEIMSLINYAKQENWAKCDEQVEKLIYIDSINNSVIKEPVKELEYINKKLIPDAVKKYKEALSEGVGAVYKSLPVNSAKATKQNALKNQQTELEKIRTEYQFILQAKLSRLDNEEGLAYVQELIEDSKSLYKNIKKDDYETYATSSCDSYVQWLNEKLTSLNSALGTGEMDSLIAKKEELQEKKMSALDKNDLDAAKEIDAEIELVDKKIDNLERRLNNIINSSTATEAEKAAAKSALGSGSVSSTIQRMLDEVISDIKNGDLDGIENRINAICEFADTNPTSVMNALTSIYEELGNQKLQNDGQSGEIDKLMETTEDIATEKVGPYTPELSESDINTVLASYFGLDAENVKDLDDLLGGDSQIIGDKEKGTSLVALAMYYADTGSENAKSLLDKYSTIMLKDNNPYVYNIYEQDSLTEYITVDKIANIKGYRYIFNGTQKEAILEEGSNYYKFSAFSKIVRRPNDKEDELEFPAGYQQTVYIHESYAKSEFGIESFYLEGTGYAVMLDSEDVTNAEAIYDVLVEIGGQE